MKPIPLYIFFHLSKSGGTTLDAHLSKHLQWDVEFVNFSNWGAHYRKAHNRPNFADRPVEERQAAKILTGHNIRAGIHRLLPDRDPRYFTVVRDPTERCVSLYNFHRSRKRTKLGFEDWYEGVYLTEYAGSATRFYAQRAFHLDEVKDADAVLATAIQLLELCWIAVTTRELDSVLRRLSEELSIPADWETQRGAGKSRALNLPYHPFNGEVVKRYAEVSDALRSRVVRDNPVDTALYEWVVDRQKRYDWL